MPSDVLALQIHASASAHAGRLARTIGLQPWDRDDARQDIALDLLQRLRRYESSRTSPASFIGFVALNQRRKLATRYRREGCRRRNEVPLHIPVASADAPGLTLADILADPSPASDPLTVLMLSRLAAQLPEPLRVLWHAFAQDGSGPESARRACGLSNAEFYRRLTTLRLLFRSYGFAPLGGLARSQSN